MLLAKITELRSFLRFYNVFQRFVPSFPRVAASPEPRLKKDQLATFLPLNNKELDTIKTLKLALTAPRVLALPYAGDHLTLGTEACYVQVGCVLLLKQQNEMTKPIGYWS